MTNKKFDAVAPDLFAIDDDGMYIVFSAGYYGSHHGQTGYQDVMKPYLVNVVDLHFGDSTIQSVSYNIAKMINLPYNDSRLYDERSVDRAGGLDVYKEDRIDGSIYKENGYYYLVIKRFGTANELWRISDLNQVSNPNAWELINSDFINQFEGSSLVKFNGKYMNYCDKMTDASGFPEEFGNNQIYVTLSDSLESGSKWKKAQKLNFIEFNPDTGSITSNAYRRHGSVLVLKDISQIRKIATYLNSIYTDSSLEVTLDTDMHNGMFRSDGYWYKCESGNYVAFAERCVDGNWYWYDADGTMARNKHVYIPNHDKWVYYDNDGVMVKGERRIGNVQFRYVDISTEYYDYYFDLITGERARNCWITMPDGRRCHYDSEGRKDAEQ